MIEIQEFPVVPQTQRTIVKITKEIWIYYDFYPEMISVSYQGPWVDRLGVRRIGITKIEDILL